MAFSRAAAFRTCFRAARPTPARPQLFRQIARRGYASGGHETAKAGGDALWAAGAIAVTVPTCWYLLQSSPDNSHAHGNHGDSHGEAHEEKGDVEEEPKDDGDEEKSENKSEDSGEEDGEDKGSEESDDSDSEDQAEDAGTPDTSDDEGEKNGGNTVKRIPDAKGGVKKRSESDSGIKQGEDTKDSIDGEEGAKDKAAASKPAGSDNTQSGKQEGLTNTDTKHPSDPTNNPGVSKKGEGSPETAKSKGTVNSSRPQSKEGK